jgi:hypothetical protein
VQHVWGRLQTPQVNVSNSTVSYTILSEKLWCTSALNKRSEAHTAFWIQYCYQNTWWNNYHTGLPPVCTRQVLYFVKPYYSRNLITQLCSKFWCVLISLPMLRGSRGSILIIVVIMCCANGIGIFLSHTQLLALIPPGVDLRLKTF